MSVESGSLHRRPDGRAIDRTPFVGREREVATLDAVLRETVAGGGRLALVAGEPGIGKTRLLAEVAKQAAAEGWVVLLGRAYESEGMPPYLPVTEALQSHLRGVPDNELVAELADRAAELALILPDVARRLPGLPPLPALDPAGERYRLFEAVCDCLVALARGAGRSGLLLGIEDLQWADESTLLLLEHMGHRLHDATIALVLNYRDTELEPARPLARTIEQLTRLTPCRQLTLRRLDLAGVSLLLAGLGGSGPPERLVEVVYRETEGNPLFVHEVYRYLMDEGRLLDAEGHWRSDLHIGEVEIPQGVRLVIGRRVGRVSEGCRRALTFAAIIGRVFDFDLLQEVSGMTEADLLDAMDEAERARLVMGGTDDSTAQLAFTHELIRQVLVGSISLPRRRALHISVGKAIERLHEGDLEPQAASLALHYAFGSQASERSKLGRYATMAGHQANDAKAWDEAAAHFRVALAAAEGKAPDVAYAGLLFDLGMALWAMGAQEEFGPVIEQSFDSYLDAGDAGRAANVALQVGDKTSWYPGLPRLLERALLLVEPGSIEEGRLLVALASYVGDVLGDDQRAQEASARAAAIFANSGDRRAELALRRHRGFGHYARARFDAALEDQLKVITLARELDEPFEQQLGYWLASFLTLAKGDLDGAIGHAEAMRKLAEQHGRNDFNMTTAAYTRSVCALGAGDWATARFVAERSSALGPHDPRLPALAALLHLELGEWSEFKGPRDRLVELLRTAPDYVMPPQAYAAWAVPYGALLTGEREFLDVVEEAARAYVASGATGLFPNSARFGLALLAVLRNDPAAANEQYAILAPFRGTNIIAATSPIRHDGDILGLLALTMGRVEDAIGHFEDALVFCRRGYRPAYAWSAYDCAGSLIMRGATGDRERARGLLGESITLARELGMKPLLERCLALEIAPSKRRPSFPEGLSEREVEVLRLVAAGRSNAEIASALVISPHTVGNHVSHIFEKLGTANRADAAAWAVRNGLAG